MVYLPWLTSRGRSVEGQEQIVRHLLFCSSNYSPLASGYLEQILKQLSKAVLLAVNGNRDQRGCIQHALYDLARLEIRPSYLTEFAYKWCSAIYGNRENLEDWERLLLVCLEVGFRHLDPWEWFTGISLTHTEHHRGLVDVDFKSQKTEAIADLIHAWTLGRHFPRPLRSLVDISTGPLVGLHDLVPFSPRLRRLVIRFVEVVGYQRLKSVGVEKLVELLNHLHVTVEDMDAEHCWTSLLLDVIRSSDGTNRLSHWYWELLVELTVSKSGSSKSKATHGLEITKYLIEVQEWGKLECWIGIIWTSFGPLNDVGITEEDLGNSMLLLFRQRPGAAQKLERWIEQWSQQCSMDIPDSFERSCKRAREAAQQQVVL